MTGAAWRTVGVLLVVSLVMAACDAGAGPATDPGAAVATPAGPSIPSPRPSVAEPTSSPAPPVATAAPPTPSPSATPAPTASPPEATPSPAPSTSPAPVARTVREYAWVFDKHPLVLRGTAGSTTYTKVLLAARTVEVGWKATTPPGTRCVFRSRVESKQMDRAATVKAALKADRPAAGKRTITANYGDAIITVTTDCATWTLKAVSKGHPGLAVVQKTDPYRVKGSTLADVREDFWDGEAAWTIRSQWRYYTNPVRVTSLTGTLRIIYEIPRWTAPAGTSDATLATWNESVAALKRHLAGDAAIAIQAAGRYLEKARGKTRFPSAGAIERYYDKLADRYIDDADVRTRAYDEATDWGRRQGIRID